RDIERALQRIEEDDYGECRECGELIDPRRLAVNPAVQSCIECAE
ncbi:MAG: TraR/DksA C4-type zinc finger protein, partial [Gammaproteobacteria bacterium]|nr:TraR/DksA C4-type zinc finger protein [Gammaproteobacteria bacterium]